MLRTSRACSMGGMEDQAPQGKKGHVNSYGRSHIHNESQAHATHLFLYLNKKQSEPSQEWNQMHPLLLFFADARPDLPRNRPKVGWSSVVNTCLSFISLILLFLLRLSLSALRLLHLFGVPINLSPPHLLLTPPLLPTNKTPNPFPPFSHTLSPSVVAIAQRLPHAPPPTKAPRCLLTPVSPFQAKHR